MTPQVAQAALTLLQRIQLTPQEIGVYMEVENALRLVMNPVAAATPAPLPPSPDTNQNLETG